VTAAWWPKLILLLGAVAAGYLALNMYSDPRSKHDQIEPYRGILGANGADCPARWLGLWEYRQKAGDSYDAEGEQIELSCQRGLVHGLYHGLEREGEHGLFYSLVPITDVRIADAERVSFTVPERELFSERPGTLDQVRKKKVPAAGFTRDELHFDGRFVEGRLTLNCTSPAGSCPEAVMVFRKGAWPPQ
jgi:hypothetical protein